MQTLKNLPKLTHLTFHHWSRASSLKASMANPGFSNFFADFKNLPHLSKLDLNLSGSKNQVSNEDFILLCESLTSLTQLQILKVSLPYANLEETGVASLSTIIPENFTLFYLNLMALRFYQRRA